MDLKQSGHDQDPVTLSRGLSCHQIAETGSYKTSIAVEFSKLQQRINELKAREQLMKIKQIRQASKLHSKAQMVSEYKIPIG